MFCTTVLGEPLNLSSFPHFPIGRLVYRHECCAWAIHLFLGKSLKFKSVVQRRLEFLKAVRFGRHVLNGLVRWASCEGLHSWGRIFILR